MTEAEQAEKQAECVVRALDAYLSSFPWPGPTITSQYQYQSASSPAHMEQTRKFLVQTLAATIRMSEPRKSDLQR